MHKYIFFETVNRKIDTILPILTIVIPKPNKVNITSKLTTTMTYLQKYIRKGKRNKIKGKKTKFLENKMI
jgi:hypothetical protein